VDLPEFYVGEKLGVSGNGMLVTDSCPVKAGGVTQCTHPMGALHASCRVEVHLVNG